MIAKDVGISDIEDANRFLRALWAELRSLFPHSAWAFGPFKMGESKCINIGQLSIGSAGGVVNVAMTYKTRGSIEYITFDQFPPATIEESSELGAAFSSAVERALIRAPQPGVRTTTGWIVSPDFQLANYAGQSFKIVRLSDSVSSVTMPVEGYDDRDADLQFKRKINHCMDLLALETGTPFWEVQRPTAETPDASALMDVFVNNPNWIDDSPVIEGQLVISTEGKKFMDLLAEDNVGGMEKMAMLKASRLYHAAKKLEAQVGEYSKIMGPDQPTICNVLFLSALEAASAIGMGRPQCCKECGQPLYRIRQRVGDLVAKYHPSPPDEMIPMLLKRGTFYHDPKTGRMIDAETAETAKEFGPNPLIKKILMKAYDERSKFLHEGEPITDHGYRWFDCIPQLDPSDPTGFDTSSTDSTWELGTFIGHCLRQVLKECVQCEAPNGG
jgi:hypothetical protein